MPCSRGCCDTPKEHYRSIQIDRNVHTTEYQREQLELKRYAQAAGEGIQPMGTKLNQVDLAMAVSDHNGRPYRGDDLIGTYYPDAKDALKPWADDQKAKFRSELGGETKRAHTQ